MTYSLVARDPESGELGVAVQSCAFRTGAVCAWAEPGVGAVATQSFTEQRYGPEGLRRMRAGAPASEALAGLLAEDELREVRQVGFVDADGRVAAHTGADCIPHAGDVQGPAYGAQGNMLRSPEVVAALAEGYAIASGPLADRLLAGLDAAEAAGGDFRGRQAAGLVVVGADASDPPYQRLVDVRVDDHPEPLRELRRRARVAAAYARRNRIEAGADADEEADAARAAGLAEHDAVLAAVFAHARNGHLEPAAALAAAQVAAEPLWRAAYERYERLGLLPPGVVPPAAG